MIITLLFTIPVVGFILTAATTDCRSRRIPNWLTVPTAAAGLIFHLVLFALQSFGVLQSPPPDGGLWDALSAQVLGIGLWSIAGFVVGFLLLFAPALLGGGGFGDVKMFAALGAWLGISWTIILFVLTILCAAFLTIIILIASGPLQTMRKVRKMQREAKSGREKKSKKAKPRRMLPLALPTSVAVLIFFVIFYSNNIANFWNFL
ncbi:MAG: A24 family peptidase [Planctomycetia bacterium]|nr:A24 family peptidase [Planctomycetia bacterium]